MKTLLMRMYDHPPDDFCDTECYATTSQLMMKPSLLIPDVVKMYKEKLVVVFARTLHPAGTPSLCTVAITA